MTLDQHSIVRACPQQMSADLGESLAIMQLQSQKYFSVRGSGLTIWNQLQQPIRVTDLVHSLTAEYVVEPQRCLAEVLGLLRQLAAAGLLETITAGAAPATCEP